MKLLVALALSLFWLTDPASLHSQAAQPHGNYAKAYDLFTQGKLQEAEELFRNFLDKDPVLQDYTLYFLGAIAASQEDQDKAQVYFAQLKRDFPRSVWLNNTNLYLAKAALKQDESEQAIELLTALGSRGVKEEIYKEAHYLLGRAQSLDRDFKLAHSTFQKLRNTFPFSSWAVKAKVEVLRIRKLFTEPLGLNQPKALLEEGNILLKEGDSREAEKVFRQLIHSRKGKSLYLPSLKGLAQVYRSTRRRNQEIKTLRKLVAEFPDQAEASDAAYRIAELCWNQGNNTKALEEFKRFEKRYPQSKLQDKAAIAMGRIYESLGVPKEAMRVFRMVPQRFPESQLRWEATWRLAWMHYLRTDFKESFTTFESIATRQAPDHFRAGSLYWQARSTEQLGNSEDAKGLYRQVRSTFSESYYRGPSADALKRLGEPLDQEKPQENQDLPDPEVTTNPDLVFHLSRAQKLADLSLHRLAVVELDEVRDQVGRDRTWHLMLMRQYAQNRGFDRSIRLALQLSHSSQELRRFRYPLAYWETIRREAIKRGVDPYLILAMIRQESLFDSEAISPASALGLMQLLPSTAKKEADRMGLSVTEVEKLFDPDLNLTLGIQHLKVLFDTYPESVSKALAAYNAGRRPVNRWGKRFASMDEQEFIERIPYRETRFYVKLVLRNYRIYKELYNGH